MMLLAAATALSVFLRAWQQQNVIHGHYLQAVATSYGLALMEVSVVLGVVAEGFAAVPFLGTGGAIGVTSSMYLHRRMRARRY